jgi:hypothetical protein
MRVVRTLPFLVAVTALVVAVLVVCTLYKVPHNFQAGVVKVKDNEYQFRFSHITQGTNHEIYSGNFIIATLKKACYQSPLSPFVRFFPRGVRGNWYSRSTATNASVLWIGWTVKDYGYTVTNGIPYPTKELGTDLSCFFCESDGSVTALPLVTAVDSPFIKELVEAWVLPLGKTNFTGCTVRLRRNGTLDDVATMQLQ